MEQEQVMMEIIMPIILHSGDARSTAMEAIYLAKDGNFTEAKEKLAAAGDILNKAHHVQTKLLQDEAGGDGINVSIMLIHSQDHLMNAMVVKDLAAEIIDLNEKIENK